MLDDSTTSAIDDIGSNLSGLVLKGENSQQLLILGLAIIVAWFVATLTRLVIKRKAGNILIENTMLGHIVQALVEVLFPLYTVLFITLAHSVCRTLKQPVEIMMQVNTVVVAWLFISLILLLTKRHLIAQILAWTVLVGTGLSVLGILEPMTRLLDSFAIEIGGLRISLMAVLRGALFFTVLMWLSKVISAALDRQLSHTTQLEMNSRILASKLVKMTLFVVAFLITLNVMGVNLTALTIFGGALGVGIGFGLQKILSNFISGIILLIERTVKIGDLIQVGGETGWVRQIGIRYTLVENLDGREIMIPNEELITTKLINWTYSNTKARVDITLSVDFDSDAGRVKQIMLSSALACKRAMTHPAPVCFMNEILPIGMQYTLMFWIADIGEGIRSAKSEVILAIVENFKKENIEFARPAG